MRAQTLRSLRGLPCLLLIASLPFGGCGDDLGEAFGDQDAIADVEDNDLSLGDGGGGSDTGAVGQDATADGA